MTVSLLPLDRSSLLEAIQESRGYVLATGRILKNPKIRSVLSLELGSFLARTNPRALPAQMSSGDRRLIETAAMPFPSVVVKRCDILSFRNWSLSMQSSMRPVSVVEVLKLGQFLFKIGY